MVKNKKYHIVYKTTNLINNKCYVGVHSTNNLDDGYLGKGFYESYDVSKIKPDVNGILAAFKKYGVSSFIKEILFIFNTAKEAYEKEKEIVNLKWVKCSKNYNLCLGGESSGVTIMREDSRKRLINYHSKEYVVVNLKTNEVFEVKNLNEWSRKHGVWSDKTNGSPLHLIIKNKLITYKKTWWVCYKTDWKGYPILRDRKICTRKITFTKKESSKKHVNLTLINPEGNSVFIKCLYSFCIQNNFEYSSFAKLCNGKLNHVNYWTSSMSNHYKIVSYFIVDNEIIKVYSIKKYARENKLDSKSLFRLKNGKLKSYKNFTRYEYQTI